MFALVALAACGGDDGTRTHDDDDGAVGAVGATSGSGSSAGACYEVLFTSWNLSASGGPSACAGYAPGPCEISQNGCDLTMNCPELGAMTVAIDANGVTDAVDVPIADGIVAQCHAEFGDDSDPSVGDLYWMELICSGQGVACEFGETMVFDPIR